MDDQTLVQVEFEQNFSNIQTVLRTLGVLCDARLHLDDGGIFPIHRIIVCAACDFFR